jgi:hypothetical protein
MLPDRARRLHGLPQEYPMTTKLTGPLKREIEIQGSAYTLTIAPDAMSLVLKGRRKGFDLQWSDLVSGDAALTTALNASLTARVAPASGEPRRRKDLKRSER